MNSRLSVVAIAVTGYFAFVHGAQAAMVEHAIDNGHSSIIFKVKHNNLTYIFGRIDNITGTVSIDHPRTPENIEFDVELKATSVDTANKKRDRHLAGKDFFNTSRHKKILFKSKSCKALEEEGKYEITGDMTLLGTTKEMTIVFHLMGMARDGGRNRLGGETTFIVKRSEFGMDKMLDSIGDEVTVTVSIQAVTAQLPAG